MTPQQIDEAAAKRLRALLDLPLPPSKVEIGVCDPSTYSPRYFDPWDAFDGIVGAYDSEIDAPAIKTLEAVRDRTTFDLQNGKHGLFVQFFLHILAGHNYVDYGTSPRGAFPTYKATDILWSEWIEKWRAWYSINWDEYLD
ncbi:hypothetical protein FJ959_08725 [Mesorhizobium sp. B2-2-4]|uniref:hypothetical protein n=1 Tax=Mesorhizobium sp. B2-2-4 TaxID=2589962 RepID=UPI00112CFA09|nr:hypothetical protein [Mesorhizobium sp. B2-2-4]TPM58950.1 hypothetical protein FJ959_08725 [Mesorhizobium sp. B2-2-4]